MHRTTNNNKQGAAKMQQNYVGLSASINHQQQTNNIDKIRVDVGTVCFKLSQYQMQSQQKKQHTNMNDINNKLLIHE